MTPYHGGVLRGRPPLAPLRRAAAALAAERACPPLRPKATAARFLRGTAATLAGHVPGDVARGQRGHASQGQMGEFAREGLEAGVVLRGEGPISLRHEGASGDVHRRIIPNRLGSVKGWLAC